MQIPSHACGFLQAAAEFDSKKSISSGGTICSWVTTKR